MKHKQSKFVIRYDNSGYFELIEGKLPNTDGQLWKGEMDTDEKIECAGSTHNKWPTMYHGWSS